MDPEPKATPDAAAELSQHLTESIEDLTAFHEAHYLGASWMQRLFDRGTAVVGTPLALVVLTLGLAGWIGGVAVFDPGRGGEDAFGWLELAATCAALLVAVLILVTQRREDLLAQRRSQLILQLAILSDKKAAKIIALLEEMRRDAPDLSDRVDAESDDMAIPTNVLEVVAAIDQMSLPSTE